MFGRVLGLAVALSALAGVVQAAPLPVDAFFTAPISRGAQLSPSGRYLALIERTRLGEVVTVTDLISHDKTTSVKAVARCVIDWVRWKGDDRLLFGMAPVSGPEPGDDSAPGDARETLTALDRDGGKAVTLAPGAGPSRRSEAVRMADALSRDPDHVLVVAPDAKGAPSLWKVDVDSGVSEFVRAGDDAAQGRIPGAAMVVRYNHRSDAAADFDVLGPTPDSRRVYVALQPRSRADGDTATLRVYDFDRKTFSEPVWPALKYDVSDVVYHDGDMALAGVCYTADTYVCDFANLELRADYALAQAAFDGPRSITPLSMSEDGRYWLLGVSGPSEPGAYYVFDRKTKHMTLAANRHPGLPAAKLGHMEAFDYISRDGASIPGYLTRPPGAPKGPLPLLVMPHGGPEARDSLSFDTWAQFFATRGYMVFQPNFRGSSGYGRKFTQAGYGQWGGKMQDDITDGVRQLIAGGQADPSRICIFGASYGGYAALYGGAQSPDLYRCVASFAGVSDLRALVDWEKSTRGHEDRYRYAVRAIGDARKDSARLQATSPLTYSAQYRPPVLLIHGARDASVPLAQSQAMDTALKRSGKDVRLIVYEGEGHSDWAPADEQSALTEIVAFVAKHIEPARIGG